MAGAAQMKPDTDQVSGDGAAPDTAAPATAPPIISNSEHDLNLFEHRGPGNPHGSNSLPRNGLGQPANLEQQIGAALNGAATPAAALGALIADCERGIVAAEEDAKREEVRAFDPALTPDPREAKAAMEDALIRSGRLRTLLPRLIRKHSEVEAAERLAQWEGEYVDLEKERDELELELAETYPDAVATLIDLFNRVADLDRRIVALHQGRPTGCALHCAAVEVTSRGLQKFGRDIPSIIKATVLFDFNTGRQLWPVIVPRDMSLFEPLPHDIRYTSRWHEAQEADAEARKAEAARVEAYYSEQARRREETERAGK
jgi:hypothetical protein